MVSLTCFGGLNEIGGNKILVETEKERFFLDFGQSFSLLDDFFVPEAFLAPRSRFGLRDYFAFNLIPKLEGLYSREAIEKTDLEFKKPEFDAVILSHPHFDHVAHIKHLHPEIPVFLGETAKTILDSVQETTTNKFFTEESVTQTFRSGKKFAVGETIIHPVHVDHSVPGAYAFIIEAKNAVIAYSGDLRKHGPRADMTQEFIEKAKEFKPDVLIIEGTRVAEKEVRKNHSEEFVEQESKKIAEKEKRLILAMRYPKDLDRFKTFYSIAKQTGRELIISLKTAHLLLSLKDDPMKLPDPCNDEAIKVYAREMKTYKKWEKCLLSKCVDSNYVASHQNECILELDFFQLTELIDVQPKGGACIHSMSEPFEEDPISQVSDQVLHNWTDAFNFSYHQLHASGHASMQEILEFVKQINPKKVLPVHTHAPELFKKSGVEAIQAEKGKKIEF